MLNGDGDKIIDDDGPISKKKQKNNRKNQSKNMSQKAVIQEYQKNKKDQQSKYQEEKIQNKKVINHNQKIFKNIQEIIPNHKPQTIWRILQSNNFKQQQTLNQLMEIPEDAIESSLMDQFNQIPSKPPDKVQQKVSPNQEGTKLITQIFQTGLDIDKTQFQQLFQEIATIIKIDQQQKGATILQINDFVDDCFSIKKVLILQNEDICLDQDDPLVIETQIFLEELIKNKVTEQKKRQNDFPTLGSITQKNNEKNYFQKIQQGYKQQKKKQEFFVPSKIPNQFIQKHNKNNIYAVNDFNQYQSSVNVEQLSKEYKGFSIDKIKFIYSRLLDYNLCKTFLDRYYCDTKVLPQKIQQPKQKIQKKFIDTNKKTESMSEKIAKIDKQYQDISLYEIRDQLDHLFKRRQLFRMTRGKITNIAHRKQLQRLSCRDDPRIRKLSQIARYKLVEEMGQSHPQQLDLHGYREEQIDDVLDEVEKMIIRQYKNANSLIKTRKVSNQVYCIVKIMTGKGLHSKYGKSVLKPTVSNWSERKGLQYTKFDDSIDVYFHVL